MLKRLEIDSIKADLAAVNALLQERSVNDDPVGHFQFSLRAEELTDRLRDTADLPSTNAEVGLFFGGRPVVGSYGIQVEFGTKVVSEFQTLVKNAFAAAEGPLGARGPVSQPERAQLMLTDVARGSFGFILKEVDHAQLVDSPMKDIMARVTDLLFRTASPDQESFENIADDVDPRVLSSLRSFFKLIDDNGATLRIVDDHRDFTLQRTEIALAKERTENVIITETEGAAKGLIFVLPSSRRFDFYPDDGGDVLRGTISQDCLNEMTAKGVASLGRIITASHKVRFQIREIRTVGRPVRKSYTLIDLFDFGS